MRVALASLLLVLALAACQTTQTEWFDISGQHRNLGQLKMSAAQCNLALEESALGQPIPASATSTPGLALSAVGVQMINQQNFLDQCMSAQGWEQRDVPVQSVPQVICRPDPKGGEICSRQN
jgi:hypothetical protein